MWPLALAFTAQVLAADSVVSIRACEDSAVRGDIPWAVTRTVRIETPAGGGTGAVISPDGFILTASHVVHGAQTIEVVFEDERRLPAKLVRDAAAADLALVRVEGTGMACLPVRSTPAKVGTDVVAIGSPGGATLSHSVSKGIVSAYRELEGRTVVQTDATINSGNSGGPLVSTDGELLGVVSFKLVGDGVEGLGFAAASTSIPAELQLRWGTTSDAGLDGSASVQLAPLAKVAPRVTLGQGLDLDPARRYTQQYRPRTRPIVLGAVLGIAGAAVTGWTLSEYNGPPMTEPEWVMLKAVNATSVGTTVIGVGLVGLGFAIPSATGPVVVRGTP